MTNRDDQTNPASREPHNGLLGTAPIAGSSGGPHTSILRASERIDGIRRAESLTSSVIAYAAPTTDIAALIAFGQLEGTHLSYTLRSSKLSSTALPPYFGLSGNGERRLADQVRERPEYDCVALVTSSDLRVAPTYAKFVESFSISYADKNNIRIANSARPKLPALSDMERADFEHLFWQGQRSLYDLSSFVLYPSPSETDLHSHVKPVDAHIGKDGIDIPNDAPTFEINVNGVWARGIEVDRDHFYVLPGSHYRLKSNKALHRKIVDRRKELENSQILAPIPGDEGRMRLLALVNLGARAKAAKVLSGSHLLAKVWESVASIPFLYDAG